MDPVDLEILRLIQRDNRISGAEIGQAVGLSVSAAAERLRRLNANGVVRANRAVLDADSVGLSLAAFIFVDLVPRADEPAFIAAMRDLACVQEVHHVAGAHSYLLKVRLPGTAALQDLIASVLKRRDDVLRTETLVVLQTGKETTELPLPGGP
jgi:Lrp/AsnC family leucine-responsive transcriptional regulator